MEQTTQMRRQDAKAPRRAEKFMVILFLSWRLGVLAAHFWGLSDVLAVSSHQRLLAAAPPCKTLFLPLCLIRIPFFKLSDANGKNCAVGLKPRSRLSIERLATDCTTAQGKRGVTIDWVGGKMGGRSGSKGNSPAWEKMQ
jgi:hypothetical protein